MKTITHSPVTPMDLEEALWLNGLRWDNLEPLDRGYLPGDVPDLPLWDQTPCYDTGEPASWGDVALLGVFAAFGLVLWTAFVVGIVSIISNLKG